MTDETDRKARRNVRALLVSAWLVGLGAALLARFDETALAWFAGVTAVLFVIAAVTVANNAAERFESGESRRVTVTKRTVVTSSGGEVIDVNAEPKS